MIPFRHSHKYNFGCSDLYFVVLLRPLAHKISACSLEIADCEWMDIREYADHPTVNNVNKLYARQFLEDRERGTCEIGKRDVLLKIKHLERQQQVYSMMHRESDGGNK